MKNYAVLDIENPNFRQNSICAIGIILVKNNQIIKKEYSLINPEDTFDRINIDITKIQKLKFEPRNVSLQYSSCEPLYNSYPS